MAVVGYYATLCQGCTIVSSVLNIAGGLALCIFGVITALDKTTRPFGYMYLGYLMVAAGLFILINSILNIVGSIRESKPSVKGGLIGTVLVVFLLLGTVGFAFMLMSKVEKGGRESYLKLKDDDKAAMERKFECCGWDDPEKDHTPNCKGKHTCDKPMGKLLKNTAFMRLLIPGALLIIQAYVLFAVGCYFRKISKAKGPKRDKNLSLVEEARIEREGGSLEPIRKSRLKRKREKKEAKKAAKLSKK